jgi:hypothetical protein
MIMHQLKSRIMLVDYSLDRIYIYVAHLILLQFLNKENFKNYFFLIALKIKKINIKILMNKNRISLLFLS